MARKASADFNARVHDIFERVARGEPSPHRLSRTELKEALERVESERQAEQPTDRDPGQR
ncbi:hypothetical protein [Haliangium sp. UPWRP_2]|uniref:hypothetical protein n=1 Tax=Haliangium sp. UPWRP_2 TaxID=1931276 RepID=UPI000B5418A3|nr:hypothetical protein [Haliangium sp. UPWRP_2]PSM31398.1 hypothetical protein BVG81_005575 [Haliangium sp. UPWRP_2]